MEWNEETIQRLRSLWQEGLSTAEIGRRMSITKNAVVGKAHRLVLSARPSPIRKIVRQGDAESAPVSRPATPAAGETPGSVARFVPRQATPPAADRLPDMRGHATWDGATRDEPAQDDAAKDNVTPLRVAQAPDAARQPSVTAARAAAPAPDATMIEPDVEPPRLRSETGAGAASRAISEPVQRRRSQSCCWPLGDPGTKQFRFCGVEPIPGKPYCVEHAQLAYVKLRDRRDTVA